MTGSDFTTALTTLGLDNHQAAQWLGVSVKSVRRYRVSGAPGPVAGMVRIAADMMKLERCDPDADGHGWYGMSWEPDGWYVERQAVIHALALDWRE